MAAYEYMQESDINFFEHDQHGGRNRSYYIWPAQLQRKSYADGRRLLRLNRNENNKFQPSLPIGIPEHDHPNIGDEAWEGGGGEVVPPHLIVARRVAAGKTEFSVCTGKGRTLKGRDLKEVRNQILRMTGFLDA